MDHRALQAKIEDMQQAAENALQRDPAFFETLHTLKTEIDHDPQVQRTTSRLQTIGKNVFRSFVPRIKVRIRTSEGEVSLPQPSEPCTHSSDQRVADLVQELRQAASAVIVRSRCRAELDMIVNEAVSASTSFEGIASEIESAGHELLICLDLSAYAQLREKTEQSGKRIPPAAREASGDWLKHSLSPSDLEFLRSMKITAGEA
jgi:hypothetical protein